MCALLHCIDAGRLWVNKGVKHNVLVRKNASGTSQRCALSVIMRCGAVSDADTYCIDGLPYV